MKTPSLHFFSGMFHGYRRWMTLFNLASIVLSVTLALVILGFVQGVRSYVEDMVQKEAAAGAVRVHLSGWQPEGAAVSFADRVGEADQRLRAAFSPDAYRGCHLWWRSEAHFLMLRHPADEDGRGIFTKLGNTLPGDPEARRVAPYKVAGSWVTDPDAEEIVLSEPAALKLVKRLPGEGGVADLVGMRIWIALPGSGDHAPAASAQVTITGVFKHMRDGACMTTPGVIQQMFARVKANANGRWYETYDRLAYRVEDLEVPLICWRTRDYAERWLYGSSRRASAEPEIVVRPDAVQTSLTVSAPQRSALPPSERMSVEQLDARYPDGYVLCSPRVWDELGYQVAPLRDVESWESQALYAYLYFHNLAAATRSRGMLEQWGFTTYMPIDQFRGLVSLVQLVTWGAFALLAMVLLAGTLGIAITLYTEVDAEQAEIGLLKALGASNGLVARAFLGKGAAIGVVGVMLGIPLATWVGHHINAGVSSAIADTAGLNEAPHGFFSIGGGMLVSVCIGVICLAALAALFPALQAAAKDPQEALRAE